MLRHGIRAAWIAAALVFACSVLASCGGEDEEPPPPPPDLPPERMLDRAFERLPESGRAAIDLDATVRQDPSAKERVAADLEGPFADEGGPLPSFGLEGEAEAAGFGVDIDLVSTGDDAFVVFFGENYRVGRDRVAAFERQGSGIDPRQWFGPAQHAGTKEVEGTDTYRVAAPLEADRVSEDLSQLGAASVGLSGPGLGEIQASIGVEDGVIRRIRINAQGLALDLVLTDLGEPQSIEPPPGGGFQPIDDLLERIPGL